ncbi:methylhydroquinone degradation carboxylesterase MhqD [Mammaliicoccus lentus]|uniref:Carboxylesterase n=1 Tax=Mammaliicoccus lentus TaxID=42858 RepID=A0A2H4UFQ0_MAMLE|nr:alpha/beta hydrolase [Mammaliicoccus lentus]ATZ72051.1 carboxylesterase [Mammaliicoccus lentus]WHI54466.1 alpha/beta hydrolase [Mammaliicoccus lentus]WHI56988.1 alpha/beta hydrolase [Mammaliicoccus lentus]WHI64834.1 alpha/beta hydrolase [Mammaliicoccus lentus]WHI85726.1 alpha/beta hydrolase [Mammaliicoccus lentus]
MKHIFKQGEQGKPVFLLLHGTGGDERDLLPLAEMLDPSYNVLSVKGEISENGMARYFKRRAEGDYDLEDLEYRGQELYDFIKESSKEYEFNLEDVIPVGFSNGSNIAINLILRESTPFQKALLFAPLYPLDLQDNQKDLSNFKVFLSMGKQDPIVTQEQSERVIEIFKERGAEVHETWVNSHEITQEAVLAAKEIL